MTSVNDISADFSQMIGQSKRQTTKRLFINDWDQFKSEIRSELREELSLLLKNKSVVFHMEKSASETESSNNSILIPYTSSNSLLNENISTTSQNTIHTKNSTHRTSRTQDTAQPSNIQKRHSRQTDNNNDCNMNSERLKLLHSRYSEIFEGDLSPKMPSTPVELLSCSTSSSPSTLMEALISSPMIHGKCTTLGTSRIMQDINVPTSPSTLPITSDVSYSGIRKPRKQKDEKMPDDKKGGQKRTSIHEVRGVREEDSSSTLK
ncbi:unnamed protein product [Heterobilharzia americana]|nr:unnamed protein product [Heterobilharzia americana]